MVPRSLIVMLASLLATGVYAMPEAQDDLKAQTIERLRLEVGEGHTLTLQDEGDLRASRKGVVDIMGLGGGRWHLSALRSGVVMMHAGLERVLVEVTRPRKTPADHRMEDWVCRRGVVCDRASVALSGRIDDWRHFMRVKAWCRKRQVCLFSIELSSKGRAALLAFLAEVLPRDCHVALSPVGFLKLAVPCRPGKSEAAPQLLRALDGATDGLIHAGQAHVRCHNLSEREAYVLSLKVYQIDESEARAWGFAPDHNVSLRLPAHGRLNAHLGAKLRASAERARRSIFALPKLRLLEGQKGRVASGGEWQHLAEQKDGHLASRWKPYGLSVEAQASHLHATKADAAPIHLSLDLKFSRPSGAAGLRSDQVTTELWVARPGEEQFVASVAMVGQQQESQRTMGLARIPLVAPLFRLFGDRQLNTTLVVTASLERLP